MCRRIIAMREQYVLSSVSMKRTNLVLDEDLLEEATRLSGERTYSKTVERALNEMVRRVKARQILDLAGSGLWQGDLKVMREDRGVYRTRRRGSR
jgi:Arc/MetJ family transcription regulator